MIEKSIFVNKHQEKIDKEVEEVLEEICIKLESEGYVNLELRFDCIKGLINPISYDINSKLQGHGWTILTTPDPENKKIKVIID